MRKEINLPKKTIDILQKAAKAQRQKLKPFLEHVLIEYAANLYVFKDTPTFHNLKEIIKRNAKKRK